MSESAPNWSAIVLAGGRSSRLGEDKSRATLAGRTLLDHVTAGIPDEVICIVVGPPPATASRILVVAIEDPPDGGPVAAVACGIAVVPTTVVVVLAVDMPFVASHTPRLLAALETAGPDIDAVVPIDASGRRQPLAAAYRTASLRHAVESLDPVRGRAMRDVLAELRVLELVIDEADATAFLDIDTPEDLEEARRTVTRSATDGTEPR